MKSLIHFDQKQFKRVRWEVSKRLLYGALVCFSNVEFDQDLIFATIVNRDVEMLKV